MYTITTPSDFKSWTIENDANGNGLSLIVENVTDLYLPFEWLQNCCIKKFGKFGGLDMNYLVNSSSMKAVTRKAREYARRNYSESYTMQDDKAARIFLARRIFETCEYCNR